MPLDVRLKHLIGLVGEIRPKPLSYVIPVVGMTSPMTAVVIYRCTVDRPGLRRDAEHFRGRRLGAWGVRVPGSPGETRNVITWQLMSSSGTRTKGRRPLQSPAGVPAGGPVASLTILDGREPLKVQL